jgi:hypothetical protein
MTERPNNSQRLDNIEKKIDKLSDAMISLARTEEKMLAMEQNNRNHFERMNRFSEKLDIIERRVTENAHTVDIINKIAWVATAALIGAIIKMFWL